MVNKKPDYEELVVVYLATHPDTKDRTQKTMLKSLKMTHYKFTKAINKLIGMGRVREEKFFQARVYTLLR